MSKMFNLQIYSNLQLDSEYFPMDKNVETFGRMAGKFGSSLSEYSKVVSLIMCHLSGCNSTAATSICRAIAPIISMHPLTPYTCNKQLINGG